MHPDSLQRVVDRLEDIYLAGHLEDAREICINYLPHVDGLQFADEGQQSKFRTLRAKLFTFGHRLRNGLDYFGNPSRLGADAVVGSESRRIPG